MRIGIAFLLLAAFTPLQTANADSAASMRALAALDARLATVGHRIAVANAPFCENRTASLGWALHDLAQYADETIAKTAFGFQRPIQISGVVAGGPAHAAGLNVNDGLIRLQSSNTTLNFHDSDRVRSNFASRIDLWYISIEAALRFNTAPVAITVLRDGKELQFTTTAAPSCPSWFAVDPKAKTDAGADGDRVRITSGLMEFATDDSQLAAVVAHELAHNLLGHPAKLATIGKGKATAIRETENEADRLSVWLLANAGYDPQAAVSFWRSYGPRKSAGIFGSPTHPHWKKRILLLQQEIETLRSTPEIQGKRQPPLLKNED